MGLSLAELLAENKESIVRRLAQTVQERAGPRYAVVPMEQLLQRMGMLFEAIYQSVAQNNPEIMRNLFVTLVSQRVEERYSMQEIQAVVSLLREITLELVESSCSLEDRFPLVRQVEDTAHAARQMISEAYLESYEEQIELQRHTLSELSTPVIKVYENILVLPLVGAIDTERARRIMEELLLGITRHQAELVIIDITGVPVVDTAVANHLIQAIKAARLLGARSILVGISGEVAQALVHLQIDLSGVVTRSNLQAGIEYALEQMGLEIVPRGSLPAEVPEEAVGEAGL